MKKLLFVCLVSLPFVANASLEVKIDDSIAKINREISKENLRMQNSSSPEIPWEVIDARESALLKSFVGGYDHLKKYSISDRYVFMYEGIKAASLSHPERMDALKGWLNKQNTTLRARKIHPKFYAEWKPLFTNIENAINDLGNERPTIENNSNNRGYLSSLTELRTDLEAMKDLKPVTKTETVFVEAHADNRTGLYKGLAAGAIALFALSLFTPRKKKIVYIKQKVKAEPVVETKPQENLPKSHLETECRNLFEKNRYLLDLAEIRVQNPNRIPFDTSIDAKSEDVKEALNWLLKGALAITNTSKEKASSIEWNCTENEGRISLNFIIHGVECDHDSLYMNSVLEGDSSAVSHFGRSEQTLEDHLPSVLFKKGNKKTIVSYGLENTSSAITH